MGGAFARPLPYLRRASQVERVGNSYRWLKVLAAMTPEQKKQNARLALILASVAALFFVGFVVRAILFGI